MLMLCCLGIPHKMKGMDIFCASPSSTAICSSMDEQRSMLRRNSRRSDRQNNSHLRPKDQPHIPCSSSKLPINPIPFYEMTRKSSAKESDHLRRKSSADICDLKSSSSGSSARFLLSDTAFLEWLPESDHPSAVVVPTQPLKYRSMRSNDSPVFRSSSSSSTRSRDQVVVHLRVSLHCKGCEAKVRKHISKMEGVTSYNINFATKKVTVIGDVNPLSVLTSVSKIKKAQFWSSATSLSSSSFSLSLSNYQN